MKKIDEMTADEIRAVILETIAPIYATARSAGLSPHEACEVVCEEIERRSNIKPRHSS